MRTNCHSFDEISTGWTCEYSEYSILPRTCLQCSAAQRIECCAAMLLLDTVPIAAAATNPNVACAEPKHPLAHGEAYCAHC